MKNIKRDSRWQINWQAKVKLEGSQTFTQCFIRDINFKGIQISLGLKLPKERFLKLSIALSDESILNIEVWVVWRRSIDGFYVYGFYFTKINEPDREKIYKFVYKYFPQEIGKKPWQELKMKIDGIGGETMQDRRIFARFPVNYPLKFIDLKANEEAEAQTQNISAKGIGLLTDKELKPQTSLEMWLNIPDKGKPLYTRGEVIWSKMLHSNKYRVGLELEKADLMGISRIFRT